jgi:hypothetical protein
MVSGALREFAQLRGNSTARAGLVACFNLREGIRQIVDLERREKPGATCPGLAQAEAALAPGEPYFFFFAFFFFDCLKPTPPGFSFRGCWAICIGAGVDVDFSSGESVTAVEPAAWADSDKATRPAAPRSALRTNDFMV